MKDNKNILQRYFIAALVVIVIVLLPAGSWYYLRTGLDYRKEALAELEAKGPFSIAYSDVNVRPYLEGFTSIVVENTDLSAQESFIGELLDQYGKSATFQVVAIRGNSDSLYIEDNLTPKYKEINIVASIPKDISQYSIVDTSGLLRGVYPTDNTSMRKLIEHTAIILPRLKESERKLNK